MIKAIIFDCWFTLFYPDLKPLPFDIFAKKLGREISDYKFMKIFEEHFMLKKYTKLEYPIKAILREFNINYSEKFVLELKNILKRGDKHIKSYPETIFVIEKLRKKYKLGIITNTSFFSFHNLDSLFQIRRKFDIVLTSYEMGILKPNPKLFNSMLKKLKVKENEVIMVGDSLKDDIKAAEDLGIKGILIDRKDKYPLYKNRITSLLELNKYI